MQTGPGDKPVKPRVPKVKKKPTVVKPPAGDVASSGGDYGMKEAKRAQKSPKVQRDQRAVYSSQPVPQRQRILANAKGPLKQNVQAVHTKAIARNKELAKGAATKDTKGNADRARAQTFLAAHPEILHPKKPEKGSHGLVGAITGAADIGIKAASKAAPYVAAAAMPAMTEALAGIDKVTGAKTLKFAKDTVSNAPKDAAELVATTPTSTYMLGKTAVTHPKKLPGMLAASYKQFAKDPLKFTKEHPVSTGLMFYPSVKVPGRVVGRGLRLAGKQTLKGETRTLPATALKQETRLSKDAAVNAKQTRAQKKNPALTIAPEEIKRRVDEHVEYRRKHTSRVEASKSKEIRPAKKALPKDQRAVFAAEELKGARGGAGTQNDRTFVKEFGATWQHDPKSGATIKPKNATEGHIHATRESAQLVADKLDKAGHGEFAVHKISENEYGVVPKIAKAQLDRHAGVGKSQATYAKVMRVSRQKFTNAVLPVSPKWLTGQVVEGTLRANIHAHGPVGVATGLIREKKVFDALEKERKGAGKEFRQRALPGGHYGGQVQEFRKTPMHEVFDSSDGKIGEWLAKASRAGEKTPGAKRVVHGWNRYTKAVFDQVNGRFIENTQQRAMLGRTLKDSPLMERKLLGLSDKAAAEAAKGLKGTEAQVAFGREVERAYGRYSNFSPTQRERNLHWTPFLPWYANAVKFLTQVLPKDHPVLTSLLAAGNLATQKDRKDLGLSLYDKNGQFSLSDKGHKPLFMMGGIPTKGGNVIRIGHYTPFALGSSKPSESLQSLVLPQFAATYKNLGGVDWKGDPLKNGPGYKAKDFSEPQTFARAIASQVEALTPGAGQAARITGLEDKLSGKKTPLITSGLDKGKRLKEAALKEVNPFRPTGAGGAPKKKKAHKVRRKTTDILGGSSGGTVDILK